SASRSARGSPSRACRERCSRERGWRLLRWPSCCGSFWGLMGGGGVVREEPGDPVTDLLDITGIAHELESVHQGDLALRRDDPPGGAVVRPEVRVAGRHDAPEELAVGRVVEEVDDLLRDGSAVPVPSPYVGVMRTKGLVICRCGSRRRSGGRSASISSFVTKRAVVSETDEKYAMRDSPV